MGARVFEDGTSFRVWAKFADQVHVAGEFNGWDTGAHPLSHEGNGYWSADVPGARYRHEYKYVIRKGTDVLWRNDPTAGTPRNAPRWVQLW